jgi:signal transduction histidine kinase
LHKELITHWIALRLRNQSVQTRLFVLSALPLAALLLCVAGANYLTWRYYENDRAISDSLESFHQVTDLTALVELKNILSKLDKKLEVDANNQRLTEAALAAVEQNVFHESQLLADEFLDSARFLTNVSVDNDSNALAETQQAFKTQSYRLSRAIAERMVHAGKSRSLTAELRRYTTLKITNDLMDRVRTVMTWDSKALIETELGESLLTTIQRNLSFLSSLNKDETSLTDEAHLREEQERARTHDITLTQSDIEVREPTRGAIFAVLELYHPEIRAVYQPLDAQLHAQFRIWSQQKKLIIGLSLLGSLVIILLAASVTMAVYRSIANPLLELTAAAKRMEQGDLSGSLDTTPPDEIGDVARSFDSLHKTFKKLNTEFVKLERAASEGESHLRGDDRGLQGEWLPLIAGMNLTLEQLDTANSKFRQAQKMDAYAKMSGGISHQFNNLLTVIMGNVELQLDQHGDQAEALRPVLQAGQRATALVAQLRTLGTESNLQLSPTNLADALEQLEESAEQFITDKITIQIAKPDQECYVHTDRITLQQAFMHLLLNARDALVEGGHVEVKLSTITLSPNSLKPVDWAKPGTYHAISFHDDGSGISSEVLPNVFEPFFSTKDHGDGTGLGLSMIYGFTRQCGGWTMIESPAIEGTRVTLYLPQVEKPVSPKTTVATSDPKPAQASVDELQTILLVDDDLLVCRLTQIMLKMMGFNVIVANDGKEGLEALQTHHQDLALVVSDVLMPHLTGPEMIQEFLASQPLACGVLFVTGYSANELPGQIGELGERFARLNKPFDMHSLGTKVDELLALTS